MREVNHLEFYSSLLLSGQLNLAKLKLLCIVKMSLATIQRCFETEACRGYCLMIKAMGMEEAKAARTPGEEEKAWQEEDN